MKKFLSVKELQDAGDDTIRYEQSQHFSQWISGLLGHNSPLYRLKILSASPLFKLDPILIDGTLRVRGRLNKALIKFDAKHPTILPNVSYLTESII